MEEKPYLEKLHKLVNYINTDIANDKNNPFTGCKLTHLKQENKDINSQWEINILNDGTITPETYEQWTWTFFKLINKYYKNTNSKKDTWEVFFNI